jgi:type IV secretory pathway ATPase VirB11/archaellum biosynthesis ATPase
VAHQRQPEVRGYRSQALFLVPTAGAIQMTISTMSAASVAQVTRRIIAGFTAVPPVG